MGDAEKTALHETIRALRADLEAVTAERDEHAAKRAEFASEARSLRVRLDEALRERDEARRERDAALRNYGEAKAWLLDAHRHEPAVREEIEEMLSSGATLPDMLREARWERDAERDVWIREIQSLIHRSPSFSDPERHLVVLGLREELRKIIRVVTGAPAPREG